jgi:hypothetical protein
VERPKTLRLGFCFDGGSKLLVVGEVVIIVGAVLYQDAGIEKGQAQP